MLLYWFSYFSYFIGCVSCLEKRAVPTTYFMLQNFWLQSSIFFFVISWLFCDIAFIWGDFLYLSKFQQHRNEAKKEWIISVKLDKVSKKLIIIFIFLSSWTNRFQKVSAFAAEESSDTVLMSIQLTGEAVWARRRHRQKSADRGSRTNFLCMKGQYSWRHRTDINSFFLCEAMKVLFF